jgi:Flp pilus assembly pilin Flp
MQSIDELAIQTAVYMQNFMHDLVERMHHDEEGQTAVEYAGILAVVAVIFGAIFALDIDQKIKDTIGPKITEILKGNN